MMHSFRHPRTALDQTALQSIQAAALKYTYKGVNMPKDPFDLALYSMLIWSEKPRTILEIGSFCGGSASWFADTLSTFGIDGHVHSFDIRKVTSLSHPRVTFHEADARDLSRAISVSFLQNLPRPWLVIEDSDHVYETCRNVLEFFHPHIRVGEYLVVEDGIVEDLGIAAHFNGGPTRALNEFLALHPQDYEIDRQYCDYFGYNFTWFPNGYLKKVSAKASNLNAK